MNILVEKRFLSSVLGGLYRQVTNRHWPR